MMMMMMTANEKVGHFKHSM